MRHTGRWKIALFLAVSAVLGAFATFPPAHAVETYKATAFPFYSQEGSIITLVLSVTGATSSTTYEFVFNIVDPSNAICSSNAEAHTTLPGETEFGLILYFPGPEFPTNSCSQTSLTGVYRVVVNQTKPVPKSNVSPGVYFLVGITDRGSYQRTTTVSVKATGYRSFEPVTVEIQTTSSLTIMLRDSIFADASGVVIDSWKVPRNATTTEQYLVTVTGSSTSKSPSDAEIIAVYPAIMSILGITPSSTSYQRTQTMDFSFQATYPSGEFASTGVGLVTLTRPDRVNITLTATYDIVSQVFVATYKTSPTNETGTWTASLQAGAFDDGWGNNGPVSPVATTTQLQPASFSVSITIKSYFVVNEQIKFNATLQYPDGTGFSSGPVYAFLSFIGGGYNYSIPVSYDSTLGLWEGAYSPNNAPGGLWSLKVSGADSATPPNSGSSTRNITLQDRPPVASFNESSTNVLTNVLVNFDGSASSDPDGTIISYAWTFGDGSTGSGHTVSHSYATAGMYTVRLNVTDNSGSTAVASATITVQDRPPTASFSASANSTVTGSVLSFNAASTTDPDGVIVSYTWDFGDGSSGSGVGPSHSYSSPGTFTVKLTVTDNSGSTASNTASVTILDRPPVVAFSVISTNPVVGTSVNFSATGTADPDGTVASYAWDFGDGSVGSGSAPSHTYSSAGTYTVKLTVTDNSGTTASSSSSVTIKAASSSSGTATVPLYWFGIIVAIIAAMLGGGFFYFRRHRVTHAKLKIDLEAVRSEAGRIESQDFFQSVKDQLKKDREGQ